MKFVFSMLILTISFAGCASPTLTPTATMMPPTTESTVDATPTPAITSTSIPPTPTGTAPSNIPTASPSTAPMPYAPVFGVFDGRTPCVDFVLAFTQYPAAECQRIKWRLTLYQDPATGEPTTYEFQGTQTSGQGTWRIVRGTKQNPNGVVYELKPASSDTTLSLLRADENVLLFLDREMRVPVGDHYLSYTLSRKDHESRGIGELRAADSDLQWKITSEKIAPVKFHGSTPCSATWNPLPVMPPNVACEQMIWNLTLEGNPTNGAPTTYKLEGAYGMAKQGTQELVNGGVKFSMAGDWSVARGSAIDPDALVYVLNPADPAKRIAFWRIDKKVLLVLDRRGAPMVGNGGWGYTLNVLK